MKKCVSALSGVAAAILLGCSAPAAPVPTEAPVMLKPIQGENTGTDRRPAFLWTEVTDAGSYQLQADDDPDFLSVEYDWTGLSGSGFTPSSDMNVSPDAPVGTRYFIRIRAVGSDGSPGPWSSPERHRYVNVGRFDMDFNGDGYSDLLVGAPSTAGSAGSAHIYYGGPSMDDAIDVSLPCFISDMHNLGHCVAAGDVNGDGFADAIVGCFPLGSLLHAPWVFVFYGSAEMDGSSAWSWSCPANMSDRYFGGSVACAGDMNADGFDDVVVGSFGYQSGTGYAAIYYGGQAQDQEPDIVLNGEAQSSYFGYSVAPAGDVNGDGFMDIIVGAYSYNSQQGRAYIYCGGDVTADVPSVTLTGESTGDRFSYGVSTAGDFNNDGYSDILIGAPGHDSFQGSAYLFLGGPVMSIVPSLSLAGEEANDNFGSSCAHMGDVNNDGYADVCIGSWGSNSEQGRACILLGSGPIPDGVDYTLSGENAGDRFGWSVSGAGDLNADGFSDYALGATSYSAGAGCVYVYNGGDDPNGGAVLQPVGDNAALGYGIASVY